MYQNFIICFMEPLYTYQDITAGYERAHKNDNKNAAAMAHNSDMYNYYMWLNQVDAERNWYYEQSAHEEELYNKYQSEAARYKALEGLGVNPALAGFGAGSGSVGNPTSSLGSPSPSTPAQTIPDDMTLKDSFDSLNTSVSNYFKGREVESSIRRLDAESSFMENSSQFRLLQEQQKYLNMLRESDNIKGDTDYKSVLKDTALDGLSRLKRLQGTYDDIAKGQAEKYRQDNRESEQRIAESKFRIEVGRDLNERENKLLAKTIQSMDSLMRLQDKQGVHFEKLAEKVVKDSELVSEEIIGRKLTNGEKAELHDMVIEEAKGNHDLWRMNHEVDKELLPIDSYAGRFGQWLFGKSHGIMK